MRLISVALCVLCAAACDTRQASGGKSMSGSLEDKLAVLEECGLTLASPFNVDELLASWDREDYEAEGYDMVLVGLGMTEERKPWRNHCVNLWHFDTECIENSGDYACIAKRMAEMAQGGLPISEIEDHVDVEAGEAWFSFVFAGERVKIECAVEDDWVDTSIFARFVGLLEQSDPSKLYVYYDLGGQCCIIGCVTKEQLKVLNGHGVKFVPLS